MDGKPEGVFVYERFKNYEYQPLVAASPAANDLKGNRVSKGLFFKLPM